MRLLLTHPLREPDELVASLQASEMKFWHVPQLEIQNLDFDLPDPLPQWIVLLSQNALRASKNKLVEALGNANGASTTKLATVGASTARLATSLNLPISFIPAVFTAAELARTLPIERGERVCLLGSGQTDPEFFEILRSRGGVTSEIPAYQVHALAQTDLPDCEAVVFTSAAGVRAFVANSNFRANAICLGPASATAASQAGFAQVQIAQQASFSSLAEKLKNL